MEYIDSLFTGQSDLFGVTVSESSRALSVDCVSEHPAVYRHLKPCSNVDESESQKKNS